MRNNYPSRRWISRFDKAFNDNGGWPGDATMNVARNEAARYYLMGVPALAAGHIIARSVRLFRNIDEMKERMGE